METMKAIAKRKSVRAYNAEQIPEDALNKILTAGCAAPVGMGKYDSMHLTVVQNKATLSLLSNAVGQTMRIDSDPFYGAPTAVIISSTKPMMPGIDYTNAGCLAENIMLASADMGIGSVLVWATGMTLEADAELKKALAIPDGFTAQFGVALGYAAADDNGEKDLSLLIGLNRV